MVSSALPDMVGVPGLEPGTSALSGLRSNQLSYTPNSGPAESLWEARICARLHTLTYGLHAKARYSLPSAFASCKEMVEATGFEPVTLGLQSRCSPS